MGPGGEPGSFYGWQGHELQDNVILPQIAVGESVSMTLIFSNMGSPQQMGWLVDEQDYTVHATLRFFASNGGPLTVKVNGVTDSEFPLTLGPSGISYMDVSAPAGSDIQKGWLLVEADDSNQSNWGYMDGQGMFRGRRIMVSAYYSIFGPSGDLLSQVAVRPTTFVHGTFSNSTMPAQLRQTTSGLVRTGIAIVNTSADDAVVNLRLIGTDGQEVATTAISIPAGGQLARFLDELFASVPAAFQGALELSTDGDGIVTMGLLQTGLVTTSLPVHHYGSWTATQ